MDRGRYVCVVAPIIMQEGKGTERGNDGYWTEDKGFF